MNKRHAALLSLLAAGAVALGGLAATRTMTARASDRTKPDPGLAARARWLDALERSTKAELARRPPPLPAIPHFAPVSIPAPPPVMPSRTLAASSPASEPAPSVTQPPAPSAPPAPTQTVRTAPPTTAAAPSGGAHVESGEHEGEHESGQTGQQYGQGSGQEQGGSDEGDD